MDTKGIQAAELLRTVKNETRSRVSDNQRAAESLNVKQGQRLEGTVIEVSRDGVAKVRINDTVITIPTGKAVTSGDSVIIRVAQLSPQVLFELLGSLGGRQQGVESLLATMAQTQTKGVQLWNLLLQGLSTQTGGQSHQFAGLTQLVDQLQQLLANAAISSQKTDQLSTTLRQVIGELNQSLEQQLGKLVQSNDPATLKQLLDTSNNSFKGLLASMTRNISQSLMQLLETGGEFKNTGTILTVAAEAINTAASFSLPKQFLQELQLLFRQSSLLLNKASGDENTNQKAALQMLLDKTSAAKTFGDVVRVLSAAKGLADTLANSDSRLSSVANDIYRELELMLLRTESGSKILMGNQLSQLLSNASGTQERVEALMQLNVTNVDKGLPLLMVFPFKFDKEIAEVQIRHKNEEKGRKGSDRPLTMVMMLKLESIGNLRLDVLLKQKQLYCHVYVEKEELSALVEEMKPAFNEQLAGRGFTLAQFACSADKEKLNQATMLVETFGDSTPNSFVNVQI